MTTKKAFFVNPSFYYKTLSIHKQIHRENLYIKPISFYERNTVLSTVALGKTFSVHNGREYLNVFVSENILGHKLGEFSITRRRNIYKKGKLKQKIKKK